MNRVSRIIISIFACFVLFGTAIVSHAQPARKEFIPEKMKESFYDDLFINTEEATKAYGNILSVRDRSMAISDEDSACIAFATEECGNRDAIPCEVKLLSIVYVDGGEEKTMNVLRGTAKTSSGSTTQNGITLTGTIGWTDGLINTFNYCSGTRSGSYSGDGHYQAQRNATVLCSGQFSGSSFYDTSDLEDSTGLQFRLIVSSNNVQLIVTTSVFD